jgi:hypothetical protein
MADFVVTIQVSSVEYTLWLRSSYIGLSKVSDNGMPKVEQFEFGEDQEDVFKDFIKESSREVSKLFSSRQGDVSGVPFEIDDNEITYRFNENEPTLNQASALKSQLNEDVKNALFSHLSVLWFNTKGENDIMNYFIGKYEKLASSIERNLYLLHD